MKNLAKIFFVQPVLVAMLVTQPAAASPVLTQEELTVLPLYCRHTQVISRNTTTNYSPDAAKWIGVLGHDFWALHHYCWGLTDLMRANKASLKRSERIFLLEQATNEFEYVYRNSQPTLVLLPEIHTRSGETFLRLHRDAEALAHFARAIELNPAYWPPYARVSDYYRERGDVAKAREYLEQGLKQVPDSKTLARMLAALDRAAPAKGAK